MSSLRNAVKRITHKERAQPKNRAKLGLLEKHGDYKKRAVDYQQKQKHLQGLRQKAEMRNPDEYYPEMHKAQIVEGKHRKTHQARLEERPDLLSPDAIKIMKHQDLAYVTNQRVKDLRKIEKLQSSLHFLDSSSSAQRKHTIFVETASEAQEFDPAKHFDTPPEMLERAFHRPKLSKLEQEAKNKQQIDHDDDNDKESKRRKRTKQSLEQITEEQAKILAKARAESYAELEARKTRVASLALAEAHLQTERNVASKGRKRKIRNAENGRPAVYIWDQIRKR